MTVGLGLARGERDRGETPHPTWRDGPLARWRPMVYNVGHSHVFGRRLQQRGGGNAQSPAQTPPTAGEVWLCIAHHAAPGIRTIAGSAANAVALCKARLVLPRPNGWRDSVSRFGGGDAQPRRSSLCLIVLMASILVTLGVVAVGAFVLRDQLGSIWPRPAVRPTSVVGSPTPSVTRVPVGASATPLPSLSPTEAGLSATPPPAATATPAPAPVHSPTPPPTSYSSTTRLQAGVQRLHATRPITGLGEGAGL